MLNIQFANQEWMLCASRALIWSKRKTVIVADIHFGKASLFREAGVPVPRGTTSADLSTLTQLIADYTPERLLILGDFFHGKSGRQDSTLDAITHWRNQYASLTIEVIRGNHDRHAGDPCDEWNMTCIDGPMIDGEIAFTHEPKTVQGCVNICGHIHPAIALADFDGSKTKLPCFFVDEQQMILPAFGRFTGTHSMKPTNTSRIYIAAAGKVILLPSSRRSDGIGRSSPVQQRASKARRNARDSA